MLTSRRLRRLVEHRERLERLQSQALGRALLRERERRTVLEAARGERERFLSAGIVAHGVVRADELLAGAAFAVRVEREIESRLAALAVSGREVGVERQQLMERRRDLRAVETLLEHRLEEERATAARRELRRLDELGGQRWLANNPEH